MVAGPGTDIYVVDMPSKRSESYLMSWRCSGPLVLPSLPVNVNYLDAVGVSSVGTMVAGYYLAALTFLLILTEAGRYFFVSASSSFHMPCRKRMAHLPL